MVMFHGKHYPCCDKTSGRCDNIPLEMYLRGKAFGVLQRLTFDLFGYKAAAALTDAYIARSQGLGGR